MSTGMSTRDDNPTMYVKTHSAPGPGQHQTPGHVEGQPQTPGQHQTPDGTSGQHLSG